MSNTLTYLHDQAFDRLKKIAEPQEIIYFINQLQSSPSQLGDYRHPDPRGRIIEVKIIGRYAVLYFYDPFANLLKILDILHTENL